MSSRPILDPPSLLTNAERGLFNSGGGGGGVNQQGGEAEYVFIALCLIKRKDKFNNWP
jgi:hypothetical protein